MRVYDLLTVSPAIEIDPPRRAPVTSVLNSRDSPLSPAPAEPLAVARDSAPFRAQQLAQAGPAAPAVLVAPYRTAPAARPAAHYIDIKA